MMAKKKKNAYTEMIKLSYSEVSYTHLKLKQNQENI